MFYHLMLYGTLGLISLHYLKRKSQKYMFLSQNVEKLIIDTYEKTNKMHNVLGKTFLNKNKKYV